MPSEKALSTGPSVYFEKISLRLGGNIILSEVDFTVDAGTIHCIIGPNGGGKTSLIRALLGQMPHTGDIRLSWHSKHTMGYVPQSLDFDDSLPMTVADFMAMCCQNKPAFTEFRKDIKDDVIAVLRRVGMEERINRPFGRLSGGERQRVLLAQALIPRPKLIILDEPAAGLDKSGITIMHDVLEELRNEGVTVLIIHHDLAVVRDMADAVTCINKKVIFSGKPSEELTPERIFTIFST